MDRPALCVSCRAHPIEHRWRPFCSQRCQIQDQARWADEAYRVESPSNSSSEPQDDDDDDG